MSRRTTDLDEQDGGRSSEVADSEQTTLGGGLVEEPEHHDDDRFVLQPGLVRYAVELPIMLLAATELIASMRQIAPTLGATVSGIVWVVVLLYGGTLVVRGYEQCQSPVEEAEVIDAYGEFYTESGGKTVPRIFIAGAIAGVLLTAYAWEPAFDHLANVVTAVLAAQSAAVPSMPPIGGLLLWGGLLFFGIELVARCADAIAVSYWSAKLYEAAQ